MDNNEKPWVFSEDMDSKKNKGGISFVEGIALYELFKTTEPDKSSSPETATGHKNSISSSVRRNRENFSAKEMGAYCLSFVNTLGGGILMFSVMMYSCVALAFHPSGKGSTHKEAKYKDIIYNQPKNGTAGYSNHTPRGKILEVGSELFEHRHTVKPLKPEDLIITIPERKEGIEENWTLPLREVMESNIPKQLLKPNKEETTPSSVRKLSFNDSTDGGSMEADGSYVHRYEYPARRVISGRITRASHYIG